jgi:hypothetical protein
MDSKEIGEITETIQKKYPKANIQKIEWDQPTGKASFFLKPSQQLLASLPANKAVRIRTAPELAATLRRDVIDRSVLDLVGKSPYEEDPKEIFTKAIKYYYENDVYGTHIDVLTNFAAKGFENDIDDDKIKAYFDTWCFDVNFKQMLDWIFFDFFRVGMVRTYKIIGKYEPGVSYLSPIPGQKLEKSILMEVGERANRINKKRLNEAMEGLSKKEKAAKKKIWSKGYMPIAYTVLNPTLIEIEGSLLFDKSRVKLTPSDELRKLLTKPGAELTDDEKEIIKLLPSDFKAAVVGGGGIPLDPMYVGAVDYRKMPYERYARPRGIKAFDSLDYKKALRQADLSTLDGISNYILKITVGNDEFPVTDQTQLETVAKLFDTPSKSFDVVWNHTLSVEKIVSPEIGEILGQDKYAQVNEDITGAIGMSRALIDGATNVNVAEAGLIVRTVIEEINYARRQVTRWIYEEYRQIANAVGFDRIPRIRWDTTVLRDVILYMSTIAQLVDRRMLSYQTALEQLGFNYPNEFNNMQNELPSVLEGILGIVGSPFQQAKQPAQGAPKGTPSSGRPKGKTVKTKQPSTQPQKKTKVQKKSPSQQPGQKPAAEASVKLIDMVKNMNQDEFNLFVNMMMSLRKNEVE